MDKTTATPTDSGDSKITDGENPGTQEPAPTVESLQAKLAELTLERNNAAKVARKRQEIIDALEAKLLDDGQGAPETPSKGNPGEPKKLDAAKAKIAELQQQNERQKELLNEKLLKDEVFRHAEKILSEDPKARDQWWKLNRDNFTLTEDGKAELKEGFESLPTFIKETVKESPWFSFTSKAGGAGVPAKGAPAGTSSGKVTVESLASMSRQDRIRAMSKDPELRESFKRHISGKD